MSNSTEEYIAPFTNSEACKIKPCLCNRATAVHTRTFSELWFLQGSFIMFSTGPNKSQILPITCVSRNQE